METVQMPSHDTPGNLRRRIRAFLTTFAAFTHELQFLTATGDEERAAERRAEDARRKTLAGSAVLYRALERPGLIPLLRRALDAGLTRSYERKLFHLADARPLIPEEDWSGWPGAEETLPEVHPTSLSAGRRRARLDYLAKRITAIRAELDVLQKKYAPHRDATNRQRQIVVGAVFLTLSCRNDRVAGWLRRLLDRQYTAVKDRKLFLLEEDGPLVPAEDQAALRPTRRQAAKTRVSDRPPGADGKTRRPPSASTPASDGGGTGTSAQSSTARAPKPEPHGDDATNPDAPEPIPGWKPHRLEVSASGSGGQTRRSVWGARLTGRAAVSALPEELRGRKIIVEDSNMFLWTTTVTDIVSRDAKGIIVRNTGRPRADGTGSRSTTDPDSSSS